MTNNIFDGFEKITKKKKEAVGLLFFFLFVQFSSVYWVPTVTVKKGERRKKNGSKQYRKANLWYSDGHAIFIFSLLDEFDYPPGLIIYAAASILFRFVLSFYHIQLMQPRYACVLSSSIQLTRSSGAAPWADEMAKRNFSNLFSGSSATTKTKSKIILKCLFETFWWQYWRTMDK